MKKRTSILLTFGTFFLLLSLTPISGSEDIAKGNIIGFVYDQDGTTPLTDAVVKIKNVSNGDVYDSTKSDTNGFFKITDVKSGIYLYGVVTQEGGYESENYFGVRINSGDTAKLSISLTPYEQKVASALEEVYKAEAKSGEILVATVIDFDARASTAEVLIVKGFLQLNDRIHAKGKRTDFYQNVKELLLGQSPVKRLFSGQTANLKVRNAVVNGDLIYLVRKRKFFALPIGIAAITAATSAVLYTQLGDEKVKSASTFKK